MHTPAVNTLPPAVIILFLSLVGIEGYFTLSEVGFLNLPNARFLAAQHFSLHPSALEWAFENNRYPRAVWQGFFTYPFVHHSFLSAAMGGVLLLALGKFVGEVLGNIAVLVIFFASAVLGGLVYGLSGQDYPLNGVYPAVYGLIGAYTFVMFALADGVREHQIRAFQLLGILLAIQLVFGIIFGGPNTWIADLIGAIVGFALAAILRPNGVRILLMKLRR